MENSLYYFFCLFFEYHVYYDFFSSDFFFFQDRAQSPFPTETLATTCRSFLVGICLLFCLGLDKLLRCNENGKNMYFIFITEL